MLRPLPTLVPRVLLGNDYGQKDSGKKFALLTNNTNQFFFFSYSMALILKSSLLNVMRSPTILGLLFLIFYPRPTYLLSSHCHVNIYIYPEMLRQAPAQRGVQRRGHPGEKNSGTERRMRQSV